ncbi:IMPACT family protein [Litchfieldella xinjiangensis]|uniref:IMPACT family protein n=1 Tax=Litchfieldella xinjiangensis TaxID=1166948 RepID=UPI0005B89263|nr:YigZ family protein [Halomonas xinjiangensis]
MAYPIPRLADGEWQETTLEIERSRFITWTCHAERAADFEAVLASARAAHPAASHHCSAFIAGPPGEQQAIGFSDDGEPGGTAGRPMYQVLEGSGLGQVGCVVIRYFGGIKLGTGGLARAYSQAVAQALDTLQTCLFTPRSHCQLALDFAGESEARAWLESRNVQVTAADYGANGVILTLAWPDDMPRELAPLEARLRGQVAWHTP